MQEKNYEALIAENKALKRLIFQFKNLLDSIPDPVFMKDEKLRWIYGNPVILNLYSIDKDNYVGKTEDQLLPEEFAASCMESDRLAVERGGISKSEERARDADGKIHFMKFSRFPPMTIRQENLPDSLALAVILQSAKKRLKHLNRRTEEAKRTRFSLRILVKH